MDHSETFALSLTYRLCIMNIYTLDLYYILDTPSGVHHLRLFSVYILHFHILVGLLLSVLIALIEVKYSANGAFFRRQNKTQYCQWQKPFVFTIQARNLRTSHTVTRQRHSASGCIVSGGYKSVIFLVHQLFLLIWINGCFIP